MILKPLVFSGLLFAAALTALNAEDRPNIVWLMAEDIGQDLACYGMKGLQTPTLDRLAAEGRKYNNAICANPICSPNRSAMMVGVNPTIINAHMHRSNRDQPLPAPYKPITSYLRDAGYTTLIGHDLVFEKGRKIDCNFKTTTTGTYDGVNSFGIFDEARSFEKGDGPFFTQIQLKATHRGDWWNGMRKASKDPVSVNEIELPPYIADTPKTRLDWATYLDTVEFIDNEVAQLIEDLKDKELLDNTLIIFIGDNGRCNLRGKGYLHEPGVRVPMILWGPDHLVKKAEINDMVSVLDISATILHLAGVKLPDYMDARPLIGTDKPMSREYVYSARDAWDEVNECMRSISTPRFSYIRNYMSELPYDQGQAYLDFHRPAIHEMRRLKAEGKLKGNAALFLAESKDPEELYDLENDPHQLVNLAGNPEYADTLAKMRGQLAEWQFNHDDLGMKDYRTRTTEISLAGNIKKWLEANRPEEWQRILDGEIGDSYKAWGAQARK